MSVCCYPSRHVITSCIQRISPNRLPTNLMFCSINSDTVMLCRSHAGQAIRRLPASTRYVNPLSIFATPNFSLHSIHLVCASSVLSSACDSASSAFILALCSDSISICCLSIFWFLMAMALVCREMTVRAVSSSSCAVVVGPVVVFLCNISKSIRMSVIFLMVGFDLRLWSVYACFRCICGSSVN